MSNVLGVKCTLGMMHRTFDITHLHLADQPVCFDYFRSLMFDFSLNPAGSGLLSILCCVLS